MNLGDPEIATIVIVAPAGHGKTYEAVALAGRVASSLPPRREILFLAHTNAAVDEARRRAMRDGVPMRCRTFDSFTVELVTAYAAALGLPAPLRPGTHGTSTFAEVSHAALQLLDRSPAIAQALGRHFPMVIADEHQDARVEHHELCLLLQSEGGSRLRFFGDEMQAIFDFGSEALVDMNKVQAAAEVCVLAEPRRWPDVPALGSWLLKAREALRGGARLPLDSAPPCVSVMHLEVAEPRGRALGGPIVAALRRALDALPEADTVAVLAWRNEDVAGVQRIARESLRMNEGAAVDIARDILPQVIDALGSPQRMALIAVDLLAAVSVGCNATVRQQLAACLEPQRVVIGRRQRVGPIAEALAPLYQRPDLYTFTRCLVQLSTAAEATGSITVHRTEPVAVLSALQPRPDQHPLDAYEEMMRSRRTQVASSRRIASTIHRSKGCEYDHVILSHAGRSGLPDTVLGRRLLYTALSRARLSVTILVPDRNPSPLLLQGGSTGPEASGLESSAEQLSLL